MKRVCVFLADGFEEIEALTVVDILRRAHVQVEMVSVTGRKNVCGAHKMEVQADLLFEEVDCGDADMFVLPGGMPGTTNLAGHAGLTALLKDSYIGGKYIAAICAAPSVLGGLGMLQGRKACCYPSFEKKLEGAEVSLEPVCVDGHIITARGMGVAIPFALQLTEILCGTEKAAEIEDSILYN